MRKSFLSGLRLRLTILIFLFSGVASYGQTITTEPNPPYNGGNSVANPSQITFVVENTNSNAIILTGVSNYMNTTEDNSVWELYYTATALSGPSTNMTISPWNLITTSAPTTVTTSGTITPINFTGLNFLIPGNTQYRFALRNISQGSIRYSGTGSPITPNTFSSGGIVLKLGDVQIAGENVGYSGGGTVLENVPRYFTGSLTFIPAVACSGTPTAGNATSTTNTACSGNPFTITLAGSTLATGLSYQWQISSDNVAWTNIPGATNNVLNTSQSSSNYYRAVVTCGSPGGGTSNSTSFFISTSSLVSGTFTIDKNTPTNIPAGTFNSFNDAYDFIKCGISGPVVFNVVSGSGPYNEQLIMAPVPGASATNTVTFNGNGETISYLSTNTNERAVIKLNGADYIRFNNLEVTATGSTTTQYGFGVHLLNGADHNIFDGLTINIDEVSTSTNYAGIVISGSATSATTTGSESDYNVFRNNTVNGGYYGATVVGLAATPINGNQFSNNIFQNYYIYGAYINGTDSTLIESNEFRKTTRNPGTATVYGVYATAVSTNLWISKNKIHSMFDADPSTTADFYGIYFTAVDATASATNIVSNNAIYDIKGDGTLYGIYNSSSDYASYYFNTISFDYTSSNATEITRGFYQLTQAAGIELKNNIISITRGGTGTKHELYFSTSSSSIVSNHNVLYIISGPNNFIGYDGASHATLNDWKLATGQDALSISTNPSFTALPDNLRPTSALINDIAVPIAGITTDITNAVRNASTPDPGAYEFTVPPCVAPPTGGTVVATPSSVCVTTSPITFNVTGATTGSGITYQWQRSTDGVTWTDIPGANSFAYVSPGISATTSFRRQITCSAQVGYSTVANIVYTPASYTTLPYTESFENTWINGCHTRDVPNNFWRNIPSSGNSSWRRDDDGASGNWTALGSGGYTPTASLGVRSARFHSWDAPSGSRGNFDIYINAATSSATKRVTFDWINTNGSDTLFILLSTDGGTTFSQLDFVRTALTWTDKAVVFSSTSPTTVLRFSARSDFGTTDIGLDNVRIVNFPPCVGMPTGGNAVGSQTLVCPGVPFSVSVQGSTDAASLQFQWQVSTNGGASWTDITGATAERYNSTGITATSSYRRRITCSGLSAFSAEATVNVNMPDYAVLPFGESFEETWISACGNREIPNNYWRNSPVSGNSSWRRNDDGVSAGWTTPTGGVYTPPASSGFYSARFHSASATSGTAGRLDLHINASTGSALKRVSFDFINAPTTASDSITILLSTNGGSSFTRLDSALTAATWRTKSITFTSTSATTVLRFEAVDRGSNTDIGLDNIYVFNFADCAGLPDGGTAVTSKSNVCAEPFTLSLTGSSSASGITYQWQKAADNASWVDIPGATGLTYTTMQGGSMWYRATVTCTISNESAKSTSVQVISPALVNGVFTIDNSIPTNVPARTFNNFNDAYNHIKCGIDGPVLFNVRQGTGSYVEQLIMTAVAGASATNTVTFRGDGLATIEFASLDANEKAVIKLRGTKHIIFDSLVINVTGDEYGYGVQLMPNTDSNTVKNSFINLPKNSPDATFAGIVINATDAGPVSTGVVLSDYNNFIGNTITGGYYSVAFMSTLSGGGSGFNSFVNNNFTDFYQYGIYMGGSYGTLIEGNKFSRPTRTSVGDFYGIYYTTQDNTNTLISKNRFFDPFGGDPASNASFFGINFAANSNGGGGGDENTVSNNLIYDINGNGITYGIVNGGSDNARYFHNTISLDNTASPSGSETRGYSQTGVAGSVILLNNLFSITRGGSGPKHGLYLGAGKIASDFNNVYVNSSGGNNFFGYYLGDRATINDWRNATNGDLNSLSTNPAFVDPANGNFAPGNGGLDNKGIPTDVVFDDINNVARDPNTPDIGAYEFTPPPCSIPPVTGATQLSSTTICQNQPLYLNVNVGPYGSGQTFQWQVSPTGLPGTFTNLGSPMLTPDTSILATSSQYYRAVISCGSSVETTNAVALTVTAALPGGTYTINKLLPNTYTGVPGGNFVSFAEAKAAMSCGILGPVVFDVTPNSGPYNEQLILDSIWGASKVNTVTFKGNGNTLTYAPSNTFERAVIKLDGADHIRFDSLVINGAGGSYGFVVQLMNNADSNIFRNNRIIAAANASLPDFAGIVINSSDENATALGKTISDANLFENNTISGGFYGVTLIGGPTLLDYPRNNVFRGNTIRDFYTYGMYVAGTLSTMIEGNDFSRPASPEVPAAVYGIYHTTEENLKDTITKNRFHDFFTITPTTTAVGTAIYHNNVDATPGNQTIVSNNIVYNMVSNGPLYAFHNIGSNYILYYHNTISFDHTASTATGITAALYYPTAASEVQFKNNMITISRGGAGSKYGIYIPAATTSLESDHNNFYITASNAFVGYNGTGRVTLTDWKLSMAPDDANSLDLNPLYTSPSTGDFKPQLTLLDDKGTFVEVRRDILNVIRNITTPDIGAYEFSPPPCATPPVAGTATVTPSVGVCLESPVTLNVTGHSPLGSITFQWESSPNGTSGWTVISPVQYFPEFNTLTTTNAYFRAAVTCNGITSYTTVADITLNNYLPAGTYTINSTLPASYSPGVSGGNFTSFQSAVDAMLCGIGGPVIFDVATGVYNEQIRIPYIRNTSATNTVLFRSETGNASSVNLTFNGNVADNYVLKLDSTRRFTFRDMTFTSTNAVYGRAVEITTTASFNNFFDNVVEMPAVTLPSSNVSGFFANQLKGSNIVLKGNTIRNGSSGIHFAGTSATALAGPGHVIDSNNVTGSYNYGIYTQYTDKLPVTRNTIRLNTAVASNAAGIYSNYNDSGMTVSHNVVLLSNTASPVYGITIQNSRSIPADSSNVYSNRITADASNTGSVYGLHVSGSKSLNVINNVIAINGAGAIAYGLYHQNNTDDISYYNNSVNITAASASGYAGYFTNTASGGFRVHNNIFSNKGGGHALFVNNPIFYFSNYNMLWSGSADLAQTSTGTPLDFANLSAWKARWNWDHQSIVYEPVFADNVELRPDLSNPDVWAMHGRGTQIADNGFDFENKPRPTTLIAGVPDLGAYEFVPTSLPTVLTMLPVTPVANSTQIFMYGTDTVMKIKWGAIAPPGITARRYSGVVPTGLFTGMDSMYFYVDTDIPGGGDYNDYNMELFYIDPWQGSIPSQHQIGLGKTNSSNQWVVGASSRTNVSKKIITQASLSFVDKFTGLINPYAPPVLPDKDSSNRGRRFWVAYPVNQLNGGSSQQMVIYLSAQEATNVQVKINGTNWVRNYFVPANTVLETEFLPKTGADNAFLNTAGLFDQGISIVSEEPIVAYAHFTGSASSGASMLMPVGVWGYEYKTLTITQDFLGAYSYFYVIADNDNTKVEITASGGVSNAGMTANVPFVVTLNKGQVYQVIASAGSTDLSGSVVKSIPNDDGRCFPVATFSGSSRTYIDCPTGSGGGDFIMQQNFPATAWGKSYLTAPSSASTDASSNQPNYYRVAVRDINTKVTRNGVPLTGLINGHYYQYLSSTADLIEADRPIMVSQYLTGACTGVGDPEMIYLSPIEQGINKIGFYRNDRQAIQVNYLTLIIPTSGLTSLVITDGGVTSTPDVIYPHPNKAGYSVVVERWTSAKSQVNVQSDEAFTAITYGLGSVESYGYNAGTLVKSLYAQGTITNTLNTSGVPNEWTCTKAPFQFTGLLPLRPTKVTWKFSAVPGLSPSTDVSFDDPAPSDSVIINGVKYYKFPVPGNYSFATPGIYPVQIIYEHPDIEACDKTGRDLIYVQVVPSPKVDFNVVYSGCVGDVAQLNAESQTVNGIVVNNWSWIFSDGTTGTGQNTTRTYTVPGTYTERLHTQTPDGCLGDTTSRDVVVFPKPVANVVQDSAAVCTGSDFTFQVQSPEAGVTYNWYNVATGGTPLATSNSFTATNVTGPQVYYLEAFSNNGCPSAARKRVVATVLQGILNTTITVSSATANSVTFSWTPVVGAIGYEVSVNGAPYIPVTGTTYTVSGLGTLASANISVKVVASNPCLNTISGPVSGCTNSNAVVTPVTQEICKNGTATMTVSSPAAGITYNWYTTATGGTPVFTGTTYSPTNITSTTSYYVSQVSTASGCTSATRTQVTVTVTPDLGNPVVKADTIRINYIRFSWNAVPGATGYEVSFDNGATWSTPSSGATGLFHVRGGLLPSQEVTILVRAIGSCGNSQGSATARTLPEKIFVPNSFSPNGDGLNDRLLSYGYGVQTMQFIVFNQWGEKVFESSSQTNGWDGTYKGKAQPSGVYMYVLRATLTDGTKVDMKGSINLIR